MRILSSTKWCIKGNPIAKRLLMEFSIELTRIYGALNASFNFHSLLHIADDVNFLHAPIDNYSAFKFENFLQYVKKLIRKGDHCIKQIHNRVLERLNVGHPLSFLASYETSSHSRHNKLLFGSTSTYEHIFYNNFKFSVNAPNNFIFHSTFKEILQITYIFESNNKFMFTGYKLSDYTDVYIEPISSSNLEIFQFQKEALEFSQDMILYEFDIDISKLMHIKHNKCNFFSTLLP